MNRVSKSKMNNIIRRSGAWMAMAWNEPGGQGHSNNEKNDINQNSRNQNSQNQQNQQNKNPWGQRGGREQGPPDLDQLIKTLLNKFKKMFFGQRSNGQSSGGGNGSGIGSGMRYQAKELNPLVWLMVGVALVIYVISGIYIVQPPERAVVTRFGKYIRTEGSGPHWIPLLIESREIVNVEQVATSDHSGLMLTRDRNIASVGVAVQYRIGDGVDDVSAFLFNVVNPVRSLQMSAESALRQVIGQSTMDEVLTLKRAEIAHAIKEQLIETLKNYHTGINVLDVTMQSARAPDEVRSAFDDVIKAATDEERTINDAKAYENRVLPEAIGTVERLKNEAIGYKQETILIAEGNVQRFNAILPHYQKAPKVMQTRLYLDSIEQILSKTSKVLIDANLGNNLISLPFDKMHPPLQTSAAMTDSTLNGFDSAQSQNYKEKN